MHNLKQMFKVSAVHVEAGLSTPSICVVTTSRYTSSLRWPHRKKSNGVRSGERGGHRTGPPRPIQRPGYSVSNQPRTGAQKCAGAPSCWFT
ncbi:hypothetical protein AVEN_82723-1 [Araneus ventricosus]|uniref:Uncharacterized protein n=1 Tax=Araneus ventricosus TaxID=182803 RepID=A0A4Y2W0K3_ARAVE|nr:hypothetical protein AVEN_200947-1 [Araneus ventricosus]GBO30919.1 hypothetical protein AVEN_82723-1 [Araneus ventricosus]